MKLIIATPAFGGMVTLGYMNSVIPTMMRLRDEGIHVELYTLGTESLISRGRNTCAMRAINGGFDKLLFIDADIVFTYEKVKMLLDSEAMIVGGTYPLKAFPIIQNFNPLVAHRDMYGRDRQMSNYAEFVHKYADENGEVEVMHIPTGFMMIDIRVLAKLSHIVDWYQSFQPETKETAQAFDFFPVRVREHQYESEDWAFCEIARAAGFKIILQTKAVCPHTGTHVYGTGQHVIIA
jgi:hypothetical protein